MENEVVITYETLFEMLRREKTRDELQELPENFSEEVKKYLNDKKQTMLSLQDDQLSEVEQEKTQRQILNIKKILNELYERREKKIVQMALSKSRMPKSVIDTAKLNPPEKELYTRLISTFNDARQEALKDILLGSISVKQENTEEQPTAKSENEELPLEPTIPEKNQEKEEAEETTSAYKISDDLKSVKFKCDVSQFVGPNLEIYGPFKAEELAVLPIQICNVLINKDKAEFSENSPSEE